MTLNEIWYGFLTGMGGGVIPALLGILFSRHLHTTQRWWEKTADEYIRIITELTKYQEMALQWKVNIFFKHECLTQDEMREDQELKTLKKENAEIRKRLRLVAMAGSILISKDANKALEKLLYGTPKLADENDMQEMEPIELAGKQYDIVKETIATINKCAKDHLKIK